MRRIRVLRPVIIPIGPSIAYVPLTQGQFSLIDREDAASVGRYNWQARWYKLGNAFYASRPVHIEDGRRILLGLHVAILEPSFGLDCDHISGATLDNRRSNLRAATPSQNGFNQRLHKNNTSGFKGVHFFKASNNFQAHIQLNRKKVHLGVFPTAELAAAAVRSAEAATLCEFRRVS